MNKTRNPKAFPSDLGHGMELRDYFAAQVISAIYNEYFWSVREGDHGVDYDWQTGLAGDAYKLADAMLAAREESK